MANATDTELVVETEHERVTRWRACELMRGGYAPTLATEMAEHPEVDLHIALDLVERGCEPSLAARILL